MEFKIGEGKSFVNEYGTGLISTAVNDGPFFFVQSAYPPHKTLGTCDISDFCYDFISYAYHIWTDPIFLTRTPDVTMTPL